MKCNRCERDENDNAIDGWVVDTSHSYQEVAAAMSDGYLVVVRVLEILFQVVLSHIDGST